MGWIAYAMVWLTFAFVWSLAGASSSGQSALQTLPFGLLAMGSAAAMGVGIWRVTARVPLDWRSPTFLVVHAIAMAIFCAVYATSWIWPDVLTGRLDSVRSELRTSPILLWNALMGSWIYLMVAGISYAIRTQQTLRSEARAAADARELAQQAQLSALRARVNPHFLFNALHSVGALVATDPARADRALERLGDLLRYVLGADEVVPLRHEWRFTHDYLALEHLRLGDRLRVDAHVDEDAQEVGVPPLILQPLVENAVRHGVANRADGGRIELTARVTSGRLRLRVANDWLPPNDAALEPDVPRAVSSGVGLDSVRRRLEALYGDRASLRVDRSATGYEVTILLPAEASE